MALVILEKVNPRISLLRLNDPDNLNAMGEEMALEFAAVVRELQGSLGQIRALIITGAGKAFSAGGNLEMLESKQQLSAEENRRRMLCFYDSFLSILKLRVPLIAAINGHAVGAGLCVACACDLRIASSNAKLGFTFVKLGLHPGMAATYFLPRILGNASASELLLTGRIIEAEEAFRRGLVSKLVKQEEVVNEAVSLAEEVACCGPEAINQLLYSLRYGSETLEKALEREAFCQSINYKSQEFKEGIRAAIEKRKASF